MYCLIGRNIFRVINMAIPDIKFDQGRYEKEAKCRLLNKQNRNILYLHYMKQHKTISLKVR